MPGPTVPRPAPTPRAMAFKPLEGSAAARSGVMRPRRSCSSMGLLVMLGGRAPEVDGGESGEDEGLQRGHEADFEDEEAEGDRQREPAQRREAQDHAQAAGHEQDQQMAREDVREEPDAEG